MTTELHQRLRKGLEECLDESEHRYITQALLEKIDEVYRGAEIDEALSERMSFDFDPSPTASHDDTCLDALPDILFVIDDAGSILQCRGGDPRHLAAPRKSLVGKRITKCPLGSIGPQFEAAMAAVRNGEHAVAVEYEFPASAGPVLFEARLSRSPDGGFLVITRRAVRQAAVPGSAKPARDSTTLPMLEAMFDATADGILVVDLEGNYVASNRIFHDMWRIPRHMLRRGQEEAVGKFALTLVKNPESVVEHVLQVRNSPQPRSSFVVPLHDGRYFECVSMPHKVGEEVLGRVWSFRDITDRIQTEKRIRYNAYHDPLTHLPNRALFQDRLTQALGRARRTGANAALFLLDLDRFKTINDTLGHAAGDQLLIEVATRLKSRKREGDTIARLGGDEFVLIVSELRHKEDTAVVAEQLLEVLRPSIQVAEHDLYVSASIGIAIYPDDGEEGASLMKSADVALYRAKELGRDSYQTFEPKLNQRAMERLVLEKDLRRAIHAHEFVLQYQPQFELKTGRICGVEALIRWKQGSEVISPAKFIPVAEECGLIVPLGSWVLQEAVRQCAEFNRLSRQPLRICVNVSALQIQRPNFANEVAQVLQETKLAPQHLVVELTESALMMNPEQGSYGMEQLQQMGIGIALDDFGTGHSSLNYVSVLPISLIKIDRFFVQNCAKRKADASILAAIVTMGHALGLKMLAEGVETEDQAAVLRTQGCDEVQGFLFGRPMPAEDLIKLL